MKLKYHIDVYTLEGKKDKNFKSNFCQVGFNQINWDGKDEFGNMLANGVYLYKVNAINLEGKKISKLGGWLYLNEYSKN